MAASSRLRSFRFKARRRLRASRWLVVLLALVLASGAVVYYRNVRPMAAQASATPPGHAGGGAGASDKADKSAAPFDPTAQHALLPAQTTSRPIDGAHVSSTPIGAEKAKVAAAPPPQARPTTGPVVASANLPSSPGAATATVPQLPTGSSQKLLADAKAKSDAGDLVGARAMLNEPLAAGRLPEGDAEAVRKAIAALNAKLIFSNQHFNDPLIEIVQIQRAGELPAIARKHGIPWEAICRVNQVSDRRIRIGQSLKVPNGPFHAVVTKHAFRMDLYLGGLPGEAGAVYVTSLGVGLGKDDSTPTGLWTIVPGSKGKNLSWTNPRTNERFEGTDPKNPLGGYWMGLKGEGGNAVGQQSYGIHGTIEPDSIGKQSSMGCIRMGHEDIALVYDLLSEGKTRVLVKE